MKIVVCGPPHSGKSVFVGSLRRYLPSESLRYIPANGDGEGDWSNNPNTIEVQSVRRKGSNDEKYMEEWKDEIVKATQSIVLVDIGGKLQDDKRRFFNACDSFIVISNDSGIRETWQTYGESLNCRCIASIDSRLEGEESISIDERGVIKGTIVGLERGKIFLQSELIRAIANKIISESGYRNVNHDEPGVWDFNKIADQLGYKTNPHDVNGTTVFYQDYNPDKAAGLRDYLEYLYQNETDRSCIKIFNSRANWVSSLAICFLSSIGVDIKYFDSRIGYIDIRRPSINDTEFDFITFSTDSKDNHTYLKAELKLNYKLTLDDYAHIELPNVCSDYPLLISGRLPNWLAASMCVAYMAIVPAIYLLQPGNGYICVWTRDNKIKLGDIIVESQY